MRVDQTRRGEWFELLRDRYQCDVAMLHVPYQGDGVVTINRAEASRDLLSQLGYDIEWHEYLMPHSVCAEEIDDISAWLKRVFADA